MRFRKSAVFSILVAVSLLFTGVALGQDHAARPKWERYAVSSQKASILLPKIPILDSAAEWCSEKTSVSYWAYAEEAAYEFRIVSKSHEKIPEECETKAEFGNATFERRLKELGAVGRPEILAKTKSRKVVSGQTTRWIIDDLGNDRWFELSITRRADIKVDEERFVNSLDLTGKETGTEIGSGSEYTIGDEPVNTGPTIAQRQNDGAKPQTAEKIVIVAKPKAKYTEQARQSNIQGSVTLRGQFMANGAVGAVQVVSRLPYGLTEQAIAAAKKIVFLPKRTDGRAMPVMITVQYTFSIY